MRQVQQPSFHYLAAFYAYSQVPYRMDGPARVLEALPNQTQSGRHLPCDETESRSNKKAPPNGR